MIFQNTDISCVVSALELKRLTIHICGVVQCALLSSIRFLSPHSRRKIKTMNRNFNRFLKQSVLLHKPERRPLYNIFILTFIQAY